MTKVGYAADTVAHVCPKEAKYRDVIVTPIMIDIFSAVPGLIHHALLLL
jgi:hypothetical protein